MLYQTRPMMTDADLSRSGRHQSLYLDRVGWVEEHDHPVIEGDWDESAEHRQPAVTRILHAPRSRNFRQFA